MMVLPVLPTRNAVLLSGTVAELAPARWRRCAGRIAAMNGCWCARAGQLGAGRHHATTVDGERLSEQAAAVSVQGAERVRVVSTAREADLLLATVEPIS